MTKSVGNLIFVISTPFSNPNNVFAPSPHTVANKGGTSMVTANSIITIESSAITMPRVKSIPPVNTICDWPTVTMATISLLTVNKKGSEATDAPQHRSQNIRGIVMLAND